MHLIDLIKGYPNNSDSPKVDFKEINELAIQRGYIVHPDIANESVREWLLEQPVDYNATFYKEWEDVRSKSRAEIAIDQIISYCFNYILEEQNVPNKGSDMVKWESLTQIEALTPKQLQNKLSSLLYSGIALKEESLKCIFDYINLKSIDIDKVKNKEALVMVCKKTNRYPTNPIEMLRYILYVSIDKTLLIKDRATIRAIKESGYYLKNFSSDEMVRLASIFNRYKVLFLAFKFNDHNNKIVNKIAKLSKKHHIPMTNGFWETLLSGNEIPIKEIDKRLDDITLFKKISLLNTIKIREKGYPLRFFGIRNGNLFVKESPQPKYQEWYKRLYGILYHDIIDRLSKKDIEKTYNIPDNLSIKLPTSEKNFIGQYPIGTSFDFSGKNLIIGIHRNAKDANGYLDFSLNNPDGTKIGWNDKFKGKENKILFSGDICDSERKTECVELFYAENGFNGTWLGKVNNFDSSRRNDEIPFKVFLAIEEIKKIKKNYMVDPNNIVFQAQLKTKKGKIESTVGVLANDKFILSEFRTGNKSVAGKSISDNYADYALMLQDCYLDLTTVLETAGFVYDEKSPNIFDTKDQIIDLLS